MFALLRWRSGKGVVAASVYIYSSSEVAAAEFKSQLDVSEVGRLHRKIQKGSVPNLGDENYQWEGKDGLKARGSIFRKGKVIVHVEATSAQLARRFASHISAAIPAV
jgi:hypothetical protein